MSKYLLRGSLEDWSAVAGIVWFFLCCFALIQGELYLHLKAAHPFCGMIWSVKRKVRVEDFETV